MQEQKLRIGALFSGIGGIELGLERTGGFKIVWQVENNEYAQKVLAKHWPDAARTQASKRIFGFSCLPGLRFKPWQQF